MFVENTRIHAVSLTSPDRQPFYETIDDLPKFVDDYPATCEDVSNREFINIIWELSGNANIIQLTVTIKGSQHCHAGNTAWFISGRLPGSMVIECDVTEEHDTELRRCNLGAVLIRKTVLPGMAIPMLKIRRPNGRFIFNMEIAIRR